MRLAAKARISSRLCSKSDVSRFSIFAARFIPVMSCTVVAVIFSEKDPHAADGVELLLQRLRGAGFPGSQIELNIAHSKGSFTADHLGPLSSSPAARAAYWAPTDALIRQLKRQ